jgi:signal transduction histidine kinase
MMEVIFQQLERGESLISKVRKLSKIAKKTQHDMKAVDIKKIIKKAIRHIRSRFQENKLRTNTDFPEESLIVKGGDLLLDAFENILLNGCIHNESDQIELWIDLSKVQKEGQNYIKIEVKDNGMGISKQRKKDIFKRSYEINHQGKGMGIGLSLVKEIIDTYGGKIWVENRVKGDYSLGSNFIVLLDEAQ